MNDLAPMQAYRAEQSRKLALALHEQERRKAVSAAVANWGNGRVISDSQWRQISASLDRHSGAAIARRPDIQAAWVEAMNATDPQPETFAARAHLLAMSPERRAELEKDWQA